MRKITVLLFFLILTGWTKLMYCSLCCLPFLPTIPVKNSFFEIIIYFWIFFFCFVKQQVITTSRVCMTCCSLFYVSVSKPKPDRYDYWSSKGKIKLNSLIHCLVETYLVQFPNSVNDIINFLLEKLFLVIVVNTL